MNLNPALVFPLNCQPIWHDATTNYPAEPALKNWLLDTSSLTERLQAHCRQFSVQVIGQARCSLPVEETQKLGGIKEAVVREVILLGDGVPWVYARSVLPISMCEGAGAAFDGLGSQPLGKILFNDARFVRAPFELGRVTAPSELHTNWVNDAHMPLWGRRSVFHFEQQRLMVAEIFLPASPAYKHVVQGIHESI